MAKTIYEKINLKITLIMALIVRLLFWPWIIHGDVNATYWWGKFASNFGLRGYYNWLNFGGYGHPDQPMLNIYYDLFIRQLYLIIYQVFWYLNVHIPIFPSKFMQWYFDNGNQMLLKLPMILADIALVYFSYQFVKKYFNSKKAKIISLILAFYPPFIYNSAVWGSGDSLINLFALLSVYFLWQKKYILFCLFYISSILYKPSLLIWAPIFLIMIIKNKIGLKNIIKSIFVSLLVIFLISYPFSPQEINPLVWFVQTMSVKILPGVMDQITANAMNFWALLYGLKPRVDNFLVFNLLNVRLFSILVCSLFYLYELINLYKHYSEKRLLLSLVNITLITFTFMTRMHERYTYPAILPLLILCFYDRRFIKYFILLSVTHSLNVYNSWFIPSFQPLISLLKNDITIRLISLINVILTLKLVSLKK